MKIKILLSLSFLVFLNYSYAQNTGPLRIADEIQVNISSNSNYINNLDTGLIFKQEFKNEGSGYIRLHIKNFDLKPNDYVKIYSPSTGKTFIYAERGKIIRTKQDSYMISEFWSDTIWEDYVVVELYSNSYNDSHYGFDIDIVAYGYSMETINSIISNDTPVNESICSVDNKEPVVCYDGTEMGRKAKAVCRLLINGGSLCTGWLLGTEGNVMTNNHCIGSATAASNTDFLFNYQHEDCAGTVNATSDLVANSATFILTDSALDFTLVELPVNPTDTYGYLSLSSTPPEVGDRIYIPQHPGGRRKEIAVNTDVNADADGFAQVTNDGSVPGSRVEYFCDTEGGSSGSPVLRYEDHLVVAIHNTGGCPNGSNGRSDNIIAVIGTDMPDGGVDDPNPEEPFVNFDDTSNIIQENTDCNFVDINLNISIAQAATATADVTLTVNSSSTSTEGIDFELLNNTVSFPAGDTVDKSVVLRVYNDGFVETDETIIIDLNLDNNGGDAVLGSKNVYALTIEDDNYNPNSGGNVIFIDENFESDLSDWTVTGNATSNFMIGDVASSATGGFNTGGNSSNFVFVSDDTCNCDMSQERIAYSIPLDFSSLTNATLSFDYSYRDDGGFYDSEAYVQVSTDGGTTWVNLGSELVTTPNSDNTWLNHTQDLSAYAGQENIMIAIFYNDLGQWGYGLAIDNISLTGLGNAPIQTDVNTSSSSQIRLNGMGTIYVFDSASTKIMSLFSNNDSFDYGCLDVAVASQGTGGQTYDGSSPPDFALEKTFVVTADNTTSTGDLNIGFYFTMDEVSGWESAVSTAGGSYTVSDLYIIRDDGGSIKELVPATLQAYGDHHIISGSFTGIDGTFTLAPQQVLSVSGNNLDRSFISIYPNPTEHDLFINSNSNILLDSYTIYNMLGQKVFGNLIENSDDTVPVNKLNSGLYFINIKSGSKSFTYKFIKQ